MVEFHGRALNEDKYYFSRLQSMNEKDRINAKRKFVQDVNIYWRGEAPFQFLTEPCGNTAFI